MIDGYMIKTPSEAKPLSADFVSEIPSGDSIDSNATSGTGFTITTSTGVASTSLTGTLTVSGSQLVITLTGGTDSMDYRVTVHAGMTTADTVFGKLYEVRVRSKVKV